MSFFKPRQSDLTDNTSVNIVEFGDRLYAMTETPLMLQVDPETLQKKGTRVSLELDCNLFTVRVYHFSSCVL